MQLFSFCLNRGRYCSHFWELNKSPPLLLSPDQTRWILNLASAEMSCGGGVSWRGGTLGGGYLGASKLFGNWLQSSRQEGHLGQEMTLHGIAVTERKNGVIWPKKWSLSVLKFDSQYRVNLTQIFFNYLESRVDFEFRQWLNFLGQNYSIFFLSVMLEEEREWVHFCHCNWSTKILGTNNN